MNRRVSKAREWLRDNWRTCEVYGYGNGWDRPHHKTLWFLPSGVLLVDTHSVRVVPTKTARDLIQQYSRLRHPFVHIRPEDARAALEGKE